MRGVPRDIDGSFKGASWVNKRSSKGVSRQFQRRFKEVSRVFKESVKCVKIPRFRVIVKLADWFCKDDDCVFLFIDYLAGRAKTGLVQSSSHACQDSKIIYLLLYYYLVNKDLRSAETVSGEKLLEVGYQDTQLFLRLKNTWIGENFEKIKILSILWLSKESPEHDADWMDWVTKFYTGLL